LRFRRIVVYGSALAFWVVVLLHVTPLVPAVTRLLTDRWEEPEADTLIVLGAEQLSDGTLGIASYWRTVYAVRAYQQGKCRKIVFSGGKMGDFNQPSLAAEMSRFAMAMGVPATAVALEERSLSTRENALFTAAIVRSWPGSKALLTSDCHMLRARKAFEVAGLAVRPAPIPDIGKRWNRWTSRSECIATVAVEIVKVAGYRARSWI